MGYLCSLVVVLGWFLLGFFKIIPFDWLYTYRWYGLAGALQVGIIFTCSCICLIRLSENHFCRIFSLEE